MAGGGGIGGRPAIGGARILTPAWHPNCRLEETARRARDYANPGHAPMLIHRKRRAVRISSTVAIRPASQTKTIFGVSTIDAATITITIPRKIAFPTCSLRARFTTISARLGAVAQNKYAPAVPEGPTFWLRRKGFCVTRCGLCRLRHSLYGLHLGSLHGSVAAPTRPATPCLAGASKPGRSATPVPPS